MMNYAKTYAGTICQNLVTISKSGKLNFLNLKFACNIDLKPKN